MAKQRWSVQVAIDTVDIAPFLRALHEIVDIGPKVPETMVDVMIRSYEEEGEKSG